MTNPEIVVGGKPGAPRSNEKKTSEKKIKKKSRGFEQDMLAEGSRHRTVLWFFGIVILVFFVWASQAPLEEVTRGNGKVVPLSRGQIVQSLEGGIVDSINVQEGQEVTANQILAVMNDTRFQSEFRDIKAQSLALSASIARLKAELAEADSIDFPEDVLAHPDIVGLQETLFEAKRRNYSETLNSMNARIDILEKRAELSREMVGKQAMSIIDGLSIDQELADLKGKRDEFRNSYFQEVSDQLAKQNAELDSLTQKLTQKQDALTRTELRSPVRGIVKSLNVTTPGAVVGPGDPIMEIVPLDDKLYVEAQIKPRDVAFLHIGQPASVKITAYDYTIYGELKGELVFISADTMVNERVRDQEPFYRVRVLTETAHLNGPEGELPIKPGMIAEVDILTGSKTVLDYLMRPILKGKDALSER